MSEDTIHIEAILDQYCSVWSNPKTEERATMLDAIWAESATYTDPLVDRLDRDALLAHIARIQSSRPGASVRRSSTVDVHHGFARFNFEVVASDGAILRHGTDFVRLDATCTHIAEIVGFFGTLDKLSDGA